MNFIHSHSHRNLAEISIPVNALSGIRTCDPRERCMTGASNHFATCQLLISYFSYIVYPLRKWKEKEHIEYHGKYSPDRRQWLPACISIIDRLCCLQGHVFPQDMAFLLCMASSTRYELCHEVFHVTSNKSRRVVRMWALWLPTYTTVPMPHNHENNGQHVLAST